MSMEMHVFFRGKLPSNAALGRAIKELGFPLAINSGGGPLEQHKGLLPIRLRGEETGVEFDVFEGRKAVEELGGRKVAPAFDRSANLRWGGDEDAMTAALCFAAALAKAASGVVFDAAAGRSLTTAKAVDAAGKALKATQRTLPLGTRPAGIKHYLEPLLRLRSDLVLVGRRLVIRPVRHVLRGALLEAGDKHRFRIWRYIMPLYAESENTGHGDYIRTAAFAVWQPHFQPLLMAVLGDDIFEPLGKITSLGDFGTRFPDDATGLIPDTIRRAQITTLVLAGERDRAALLAAQHDSPGFRAHFRGLVKDIRATCEQCRAKEAETVKALALEDIWEPSRFPIELPTAKRRSVAEPVFAANPWPAPPPWLWQQLPTQHGDVRFAKGELRRGGEVRLFVALTRKQAEERHRALEDYTLAARLPEGTILTIRHSTQHDRNEPPRPGRARPRPSYDIVLYEISERIVADATTIYQGPKTVELTRIEVWAADASLQLWQCHFDLRAREKSIHDWRSGSMVHSDAPLSHAEGDLCLFPKPAFGEYAVFVERVRSLLRAAGYGETK